VRRLSLNPVMAKKSAGLLLFRRRGSGVEILLAHPGGPFWARKDDGAWTIPKGLIDQGEDPLDAAVRECQEELGILISGEFLPLTPLTQSGGKVVLAWAVESDFDPQTLNSNTFEMEWPPRSGKRQAFPEVDRAEWFPPQTARQKILKGLAPFIDELLALLR
jgi:predicted NUDIX family NTP pyrophosphohydrolase